VRVLAECINRRRDLAAHPEQTVTAGQINAMLLINEILHRMIQIYLRQAAPDAIRKTLEELAKSPGTTATEQTIRKFLEMFPPGPIYRNELTVAEYLAGHTDGIPNNEIVLTDMILVSLANDNPALRPVVELVDATPLAETTAFEEIISAIHAHFETQPPFGPDRQNLLDMLRSPALAAPNSLPDQLRFMQTHWGYLLEDYLYRILTSIDLIREENRRLFTGPGPSVVYQFDELEMDVEHYSPDRDWMPRLTLLAKNTYVWLDQLSKTYNRSITRLDQIPDETLGRIARRGFTGLWLIGLWERSEASKQIKRLSGNPEAVASAYSLFDYTIAEDLGGETAYQELRERAQAHGIRLASDMVPNHMGIDSRWVIEHPDWFISLEHSPYPWYTFNGPDLSSNARVGIYLDDHYYDCSDAAVVFKRVDLWTGDERYIYHGNDGTTMPWNDTAQLNYLKPEVREAVIQTILNIAKKFSIIRFDAAMTLTKKHYQRLWFPEPGHGGGIPSRAEYGMTRQEFDACMPVEFWREVVDRVQEEAPDTLLLAEAFWLMEGYFVRNLGMHRVYNSAFMNMLRDEENAKYRATMKNTLEFDPQILKRYVNFMSNPDERTAVDQFGEGDKYFGICTLMVTMPGLPMFGHGQIEGFAEKYGMEYRRAYWDEKPSQSLVERHEREIFPLLRKRRLFADVTNFLMYDFHTVEGQINEDVFAYSNRVGSERALVVYHNKYAETRGWLHTSVPYTVRREADGEKELRQKTLVEGLDIVPDENTFIIFRDHTSGLEYIRNSQDLAEHGLYVSLGAYKYRVFLGFREVRSDGQDGYAELASSLEGRGVPDLERALQEIRLSPIHTPFRELASADLYRRISQARTSASTESTQETWHRDVKRLADEFRQKTLRVLEGIKQYQLKTGAETGYDSAILAAIADEVRQKFEVVLAFPRLDQDDPLPQLPAKPTVAAEHPGSHFTDDLTPQATLLAWLCTHALDRVISPDVTGDHHAWHDEWLLDDILADLFQNLGLDEHTARRAVTAVRILTRHQAWHERANRAHLRAYNVLAVWLTDEDVHEFVCLNRFEGVLWFNKEAFDQLCWWMLAIATITITADPFSSPDEKRDGIARAHSMITLLQQAEEQSGYSVERLLEVLRD